MISEFAIWRATDRLWCIRVHLTALPDVPVARTSINMKDTLFPWHSSKGESPAVALIGAAMAGLFHNDIPFKALDDVTAPSKDGIGNDKPRLNEVVQDGRCAIGNGFVARRFLVSWCLAVSIIFLASTSSAEIAPSSIPENATYDAAGTDWSCDDGFFRAGDTCIPAKIPANAWQIRYGIGFGWRCKYGFQTVREACVAVIVPPHGYLNSFGDNWECERGYRKSDASCVTIDVPPHAFLDNKSYGSGWTCEYGYLSDGAKCTPVIVPDGGYLSDEDNGNGWKCRRGYRRSDSRCQRIPVPENAYLTGHSFGKGWECMRGFRESDTSCDPIMLPENAHLDYVGNEWVCNRPFQKADDGCIIE